MDRGARREAAGRAFRPGESFRARRSGAWHRLPGKRGARRARPRPRGAGHEIARPGKPRQAAGAWPALRRLSHLPSRLAEARPSCASDSAPCAQAWRLRDRRARGNHAIRLFGSHLLPGRPGSLQDALSRGGLQALRQAGGARRHPRAARRPRPPGGAIPAGPHARDAAGRRRGRRRLCRDRPNDLARGLRGRRLLGDLDLARLCGDETRRSRHHGGARAHTGGASGASGKCGSGAARPRREVRRGGTRRCRVPGLECLARRPER